MNTGEKEKRLTFECFSKWGRERFSNPSGTREPLMACWPTQAIIWEMLMKDPEKRQKKIITLIIRVRRIYRGFIYKQKCTSYQNKEKSVKLWVPLCYFLMEVNFLKYSFSRINISLESEENPHLLNLTNSMNHFIFKWLLCLALLFFHRDYKTFYRIDFNSHLPRDTAQPGEHIIQNPR